MLWIQKKRLEFLGCRDGEYTIYRAYGDCIQSPYTIDRVAANFAYQEKMWERNNRQTAKLRERQAYLVAQWQSLQKPSYILEKDVYALRHNRSIQRRMKREEPEKKRLYQEIYQVYAQIQNKILRTEKKVRRKREHAVQQIAAYLRGISMYKQGVYFDYHRLNDTAVQEEYLEKYAYLDRICREIIEQEGRL